MTEEQKPKKRPDIIKLATDNEYRWQVINDFLSDPDTYVKLGGFLAKLPPEAGAALGVALAPCIPAPQVEIDYERLAVEIVKATPQGNGGVNTQEIVDTVKGQLGAQIVQTIDEVKGQLMQVMAAVKGIQDALPETVKKLASPYFEEQFALFDAKAKELAKELATSSRQSPTSHALVPDTPEEMVVDTPQDGFSKVYALITGLFQQFGPMVLDAWVKRSTAMASLQEEKAKALLTGMTLGNKWKGGASAEQIAGEYLDALKTPKV